MSKQIFDEFDHLISLLIMLACNFWQRNRCINSGDPRKDGNKLARRNLLHKSIHVFFAEYKTTRHAIKPVRY